MLKSIFIFAFTLAFFSTIFSQQLIPYRKNNKWGYANTKGEVVIKPQYNAANIFTTNITAVKKDDKYGFIDQAGNPVTKFEFTRVSEFYNGQASVWTKDTAYCINRFGEKIRGSVFCDGDKDYLQHFDIYTKNGKTGLINYAYFSESLIRDSLPAVWDQIIINDLYAAVKKENKWGVINKLGDLTAELIYDTIELDKNIYYRQFFKVKKDNKYGFLDEKGKEIVPPKYVKADFFSSSLARVWINDTFWFYIDKTGREYYEK